MARDVQINAPITTAEMILVGAGKLARRGKPIRMDDLVVTTWTLFPECFSLTSAGVRYPNSNRVIAKLSGPLGLCGKGMLTRLSEGQFVLTSAGAERVAKLRQALSAVPSAASLVPRARRSAERNEAIGAKILAYLRRHPNQTLRDLERALELSGSAAADACKRLVVSKTVERTKRAKQFATYAAAPRAVARTSP